MPSQLDIIFHTSLDVYDQNTHRLAGGEMEGKPILFYFSYPFIVAYLHVDILKYRESNKYNPDPKMEEVTDSQKVTQMVLSFMN